MTTDVDEETRYETLTSVRKVPGPLAQPVALLWEIEDAYSSLFDEAHREPVDFASVTVIVMAWTLAVQLA